MFRLQTWHVRGEQIKQIETVVLAHLGVGNFPLVSICKRGAELLDLVAELVIEKLVQEHLCDDLVLIAVVTQTVRLTGRLEGVDEFSGIPLDVLAHEV